MNISRLIFLVYISAWLLVVSGSVDAVSGDVLVEVAANAMVVSLFVGFGLNVNAFLIRNQNNEYLSLSDRILYIRQHIGNVIAFFVIPFCVSSASSLVVVGRQASIVEALFGTSSYILILMLGFVFFIALPAAMVTYVYGWKNSESIDT